MFGRLSAIDSFLALSEVIGHAVLITLA